MSAAKKAELLELMLGILLKIDDERTLRLLYRRVNRAYVTDGRDC